MGQHEGVIDLAQGQLIPHACFALAQRVHSTPDCRHPLTDIEVKPLDTRRVDGLATGCQDLLDGQLGAEDDAVCDAHEAPTPGRLHYLRIAQRGPWHPPRFRSWPFVLAPFGLYPMVTMGQDSGAILFEVMYLVATD